MSGRTHEWRCGDETVLVLVGSAEGRVGVCRGGRRGHPQECCRHFALEDEK